MIIFNEGFFRWHYSNRNVTETTEMALDDLMDVTVKLLDYVRDSRDTLDMTAPIAGVEREVFNQREKDHMVDVKILYLNARNLRRAAMGLAAVFLAVGWFRSREMLTSMLKGTRYHIPAMLLVVAAVAGLFAMDFTRYWNMFHEIFFSNDLWILNPRTDIMINMVPESYFFSIVMIGVVQFVALIGSAIILCQWGYRRLSKAA